MDKFKSFLLYSFIIFIVVFLTYWSFSTLDSGSQLENIQKIKQLEIENRNLKKEISSLNSTLEEKENIVLEEEVGVKQEKEEAKSENIVYKYQSLINELQKLVDGKYILKLKSSGTRVGTIQKFLNVYNNTSNKVDNDYGKSTEKLVSDFQKAQGLSAGGIVGEETLVKMIEWLKKQN